MPGLPAIGGIVRGGKMLGESAHAARAAERGIEAAKAAENAEEFSKFFRWMDRVENIGENQRMGLRYQDYARDTLDLARGGKLSETGMKTYRITDGTVKATRDIAEIKHVRRLKVTDQTIGLLRGAEQRGCKVMFVYDPKWTVNWESFAKTMEKRGFENFYGCPLEWLL